MNISGIGISYNFNKAPNVSTVNFEGKSKFARQCAAEAIRPKHVKPYIANKNFSRYNPIVKDFGSYKIPVHNEEISKRLKPEYSGAEFKELFDFTKSKGTFDYVMDSKTGFVKTSLINRKENVLMSDMIWITDTCNNLELVKSQHPDDCTKVLNKLADLYEGQKPEFDKVIEKPSLYKKNGINVWQGQVGVGHCFVPQTQKPHHWFARTRLESVGNYLQQASDIITTGLNKGKYGYKSASEVPDTVIDSVANCTKYLKSINYPDARSCGAWEEQTFMGSLTSDTSVCNQGMREVIKLMFQPTENKELMKVRERILNSKHGDVFRDKKGLDTLLKSGEKRVADMPDIETLTKLPHGATPKVAKDYVRYYDSAMAFMPQTEKIDPKDIYRDSAKKLYVLKKLEKNLVRDNGAIRYKGDIYLNLDFHTLKNTYTDNKKTNEAEWFLTSEISCGYGAVAKQLLENIEQKGSVNDKDRKLLKIALKGETEHINRSYARITPKNMTKSNMYACPAYKVPEAYEAVTTKSGKIKYVPGAHNPLTWAESSLYKASDIYLKNLEKAENLL